jgi:tetratricopeptide (TPR) repeat protein
MQSGVRLLEAKDYLGALAVFRGAYARFASTKILLNIGTTYKLLGRNAEAANAYQQYLDAPDVDPGKQGEVERLLVELDKTVGKLEIAVTPEGAEVQVNNDAPVPAAKAVRYRVAPGELTVNARKDGFNSEAKQAQITAGASLAITLELTAMPEEAVRIIEVPVESSPELVEESAGGRSRIGVLALAHLDIPRGGAGLVGVTGDLTDALQLQGAIIIGPTSEQEVTVSGSYVGAAYAFMTGGLRPFASAGMPVFFSDGARFAVRGAGGIELQLNRHISLIAELGLEYVFNPEPMYKTNVFVPAIGASGRL